MTFRRFATGAALAIAGIVAAVGIGLLANTISGDSVGLGAEPLSAGETLAPPTTATDEARARRHRERERERQREREREREQPDEVRTTGADDLDDIAPPTTTFEDDDNSGSGSDDSGGGDDSSGRGRGRGRGRGGDDD